MKEMILKGWIKLNFLKDRVGTPAIETVALIAIITLGVMVAFEPLKNTIVSVFNTVNDGLSEYLND